MMYCSKLGLNLGKVGLTNSLPKISSIRTLAVE